MAQSHVLDNVEQLTLHALQGSAAAGAESQRPFRTRRLWRDSPGCARRSFGDINNDGWMDAVITTLGGPPVCC